MNTGISVPMFGVGEQLLFRSDRHWYGKYIEKTGFNDTSGWYYVLDDGTRITELAYIKLFLTDRRAMIEEGLDSSPSVERQFTEIVNALKE